MLDTLYAGAVWSTPNSEGMYSVNFRSSLAPRTCTSCVLRGAETGSVEIRTCGSNVDRFSGVVSRSVRLAEAASFASSESAAGGERTRIVMLEKSGRD